MYTWSFGLVTNSGYSNNNSGSLQLSQLLRADFEKNTAMNGTAMSDADIMAESYAEPSSGLPPGGPPPPPPPPPPPMSASSVLPPGALNHTSAGVGGGNGGSGNGGGTGSGASNGNGSCNNGGGGGGGGTNVTSTNDMTENGCALSVLPPGALNVSTLCENGALPSNGSPGCLMNSSGSPGSRITCRFCGKRFSQSGYVKAHERIHTGEKPFQCSVCGKQFSDPSNWKKHERVHTRQMSEATSDKSHLLKQSISNLPSLVTPRRIKAESPSNTCKICGKMFSSQSSLATHRRIHTGERPYKCLTCGKAFTQVGTLRTHERVHTGEKPYQCKICGRTFAQCGSYKMHERRHMSMTYRRCRLCQMSFGTWHELQDHVATHHANQYNPALIYSLSDGQGADIGMPNGDYDHTGGNTPPGSLIIDPDEGKPDYSSHIPLAFSSPDVSKSLAKASLSPMSSAPSLNAFVPQSINSIAQSLNSKSFNSSMDHPEDLSTHSFHSDNIQKSEISEGQENIPPPNEEPVDMITTTNRDRRFSSESIINSSNRESNSNQIFRYETSHYESLLDNDITPTKPAHQSSENSSICSSKSPDGALLQDPIISHDDNSQQQQQQQPSAITRLNLNSRMIPSSSSSTSSNTRKQKHPMRRCSSTNGSEYDTPAQPSSPSPGIVVMTQKDRDADDQSMLTYLLQKGKVFKCVHCHIVFDDCSTYVLHNGFHSHNGEPFRCGICHLNCKDRIDFNCHLTSHIK